MRRRGEDERGLGPLSPEELDRITRAVVEAEARTAAEIRVHIVERLGPFDRPRRRAIREFFRLGMDRTRDATGVLLFVALDRRRFEIVADRGAAAALPADAWEELARSITRAIHERGLGEGLVEGIRRLGARLAEALPPRADDRNELPDTVSLGETKARQRDGEGDDLSDSD